MYLITTYHIEKDLWENIEICGFQSQITAKIVNRASRGSTAPTTVMALGSTIFIVDPWVGISKWSGEREEQFGTPLDPIWTSENNGYFATYLRAGCGSEPVWLRGPKTSPKVPVIYGATSGGPNPKLMMTLEKACPPPPPLKQKWPQDQVKHIIW